MGAFTHELKTPMTGILGYADLLRTMQPDPEEQREAAGAIFHEAKRLEDLSGKLLKLAAPGRGGPHAWPHKPGRRRGRGCAQRCCAAPCARTAGPRSAGPRAGCGWWATATFCATWLLNLFTNAAKAGPGGRIEVRAAAEDGTVTLAVQDHGCGIPADHLDRVTEPFYMVGQIPRPQAGRQRPGPGAVRAHCRSPRRPAAV